MTKGPSRGAAAITGVAVTGILTILLAMYAAKLVVQFCPRGENCEITAQLLFGAAMILSFVIAGAVGLVARDLVERWVR
ncbi:MAG TPA: hypothetical protein VFR36_02930 [Sphingomicrobium sp.]|nr:hypothetical protein [Sphingomicrobium sp.]